MSVVDGLVTVPKLWLTDDKKYTFWPSNVHTAQCINLIKSCAEVNVQWEKYEIEFIYGTAETYKRAREKEKLAEKVSDINTTSDEEENKRKRKLRSKKIFTSSESESDDVSVVAKLPRKNKSLPLQLMYPKPPSLKATSVSSVTKNMDHIEKNKSDSDIENEEEIGKYQTSNNSGPLKNTNDNSCEKNVAHNTNQEATEDKNFKTFVIKSLVDITNRIKRCEFLLKKKQNNSSEQLENQIYDTENNILDEKFPMKNLDDVRNIEQQLKHDETFKKQVKSELYFCSQNTMKKTVTKIMKILFTDEVAAKFSWTGQKENKQKFETLFLWKIIFGVIRSKSSRMSMKGM
ncbi:IgA FC receptor-like isoform X2 [Polyergus mexicanus]|uniref:IgA FC receptor-like isoform X2 n=1 Tax=Polyergus mexicanus TaxID=615972 RepID=UPI0038B53C65